MRIKCLIIDDEPSAQRVLKHFISEVAFLELVCTCNNAVEAMEWLNTKSEFDLMFLDINMPKISGLTFYKALQNPPQVIFTTAYSQYALEGFEVNAVDYLLKPFSFERFLTAVNRVVERQGVKSNNPSEAPFLLIKANKTIHKVNPQHIQYIEAFGDYVKLHLKDQVIVTNSTFGSILEKLKPHNVIRIHKSFAINLTQMNRIEGNQVFLEDHRIPIGQKYKPEFLKFLNENP